MSYLAKLDKVEDSQKWGQIREWMSECPLAFYKELRNDRPVSELPGMMLAARFADCTTILRQHDIFTVALYKAKQGEFWMAQDDTARHWREKGVMQSILDLEQVPSIRQFVAEKASGLLAAAAGELEVVNGLGRAVPILLLQDRWGFDQSDASDLIDWSYWNQYDAFHNQPWDEPFVGDPDAIAAKRVESNEKLAAYMAGVLQRRGEALAAGIAGDDPPTRLLRLAMSSGIKFDPARVGQNVGGLLIGSVETTSHAAINALAELLSRPEVLSKAQEAAKASNTAEFDGYVFEALRFKPAFPYIFRYCEQPTQLAKGSKNITDIPAGTPVLALVHSAMFDESAFSNPEGFDASRSATNMFHFGMGLHECLGRHVGHEMIAEIVRQVLLLPGIKAAGPIDKRGGPVPEHFLLRWDCPSTIESDRG